MDRPVADWSNVVLKRDTYGQLLDAIADCNYSALYTCLRKVQKKFNYDEAYRLCSRAIQSGCTVKAFAAILEHCAPALEDFVDYGSGNNHLYYSDSPNCGGLVQEAAACGQSHLLQYLLDHGCSPNARSARDCSALEAALWNGAMGCVTLLEQRDDVDFTITDSILELWGSIGLDSVQDTCFRIIAGRLLGEGKGVFHQEIPLLPGLTVLHAARDDNWPLVMRICRESTVTDKQGKQVLDSYMFHSSELNVSQCAALLDALFTACPGLLRCEYPRYVLSICMLSGDKDVRAQLQPWVDRMPGRMIVLCGRRLAEPNYDIVDCLSRWDTCMGDRLRPVLRRDKLLPVRAMAQTEDESIRILLERTMVRGTHKKGEVSRLAMDVLQMASPNLLAELCAENKLFAQEDMTALLTYCEENVHQKALEKRTILLAFGKKQVDYEL